MSWSAVTINGVAVPGASVSFVEPKRKPTLALGLDGAAQFTAKLTFVGDGMARLAAFIRRSEREHRRVARNARRVGQGARRALRRRQRGEARRLATCYVRDIQRRECFGVARVPRPAGWAHNMARAASIAQLLAATWNYVPRERRRP